MIPNIPSIADFINQAHSETLDYIEIELMEKLLRIDRLNKMRDELAEIKQLCKEAE